MIAQDLDNLFNEHKKLCTGCPILKKSLPDHAIMDHEGDSEVDVLFLSDSLKMHQGDFSAFRGNELNLISRTLLNLSIPDTIKIGFTASVKCPNITNDLMPATAKKICRNHLTESLKVYKPKLVFACGKLATSMILSKNIKESTARGKSYTVSVEGVGDIVVIPIFHPWQVISEPKNSFLFINDIENAVNTHILGIEKKNNFSYKVFDTIGEIEDNWEEFTTTSKHISIDIETTGLNFLEDTIHTVSISILNDDLVTVEKTIVAPLDHFEAKKSNDYKVKLIDFLTAVVSNKSNRKILQGGSFDIKFLMRYGVEGFTNVWDTKLMQHIVREDIPKSLSDLVAYYCPGEV